ncbi:MAG: hypothetical protein CBC45_004835 [Euryarchaeota archaeon TMED85]|nr:MAG: hypothetical protein CMA04_004000 [Euryarchaeota archaeon]RPG74459.1 MAG: hypothetical protein CBC45_004835 [Euryarchaeota archaeon TMED85]|tara:strand:- start:1635 stop:2261 length:627 start_codon:yes stop_codon:yes gene_type:complete
MIFDHVFPTSDIISLISARLIQTTTNDSILLLHPSAEIGMPTNSCGIFSSVNILNELQLEPLPNSLNISSSSLRSEWFEKHLAIVLANNGAKISTRATFKQISSNTGEIRGSTPLMGEISFNILHNISLPESNSHKWYCYIHSDKPPPEISFFSQRDDTSFESWSIKPITIPNVFENKIGTGTTQSPNTIDINLEIAKNYLDSRLGPN